MPTSNPDSPALPGAATGIGVPRDWDDAEPVIHVRDLNHYYAQGPARNQVLFNNELDVMAGEIVIMTGPSGSGKTTLLTLIGGLRTVQEGSLQVLGREMAGLGRAELMDVRRGIGFIFQAHNLLESLTAYQHVRMALQLGDHDARAMHERAVEVLTALGLERRIHYKPQALSGGQRQRVAIARALANRPRLILADEPTAALDEKSGRDVVNLLQALARNQGSTSLIVTHDNRILDVADRIVNMVDGRIKSNVLIKESVLLCEFLSKCQVFSGLMPSALANVAEKMSRSRHRDETVVFRQGDEGDQFYVIRHGAVDIIQNDGRPERRVLATLGVGEFFGEMALLTGERRSASAVARGDLETYSLSKPAFREAVEASASFKEELYRVYSQRH
jgi:putative ABC transport system ATP-binding protein